MPGETALPDPFTDKDRARLHRFATGDVASSRVAASARAALAHIDHLEAAIRKHRREICREDEVDWLGPADRALYAALEPASTKEGE